MISLRHRSASSNLSALWEWDPARQVIELVLQLGSAKPLAFSVRVCTTTEPKLFAHPIKRVDGESWQIMPVIYAPGGPRDFCSVYPRDCSNRQGVVGVIPCSMHAAIGPSEHIFLTNAPPDVARELEEWMSRHEQQAEETHSQGL